MLSRNRLRSFKYSQVTSTLVEVARDYADPLRLSDRSLKYFSLVSGFKFEHERREDRIGILRSPQSDFN